MPVCSVASSASGRPLSSEGQPKPLTNCRSGEITSYDWTSDGNLVMVRGETRRDVVVIKNFRSRDQ